MEVLRFKGQLAKRVGAGYGSIYNHTIYTYSCLRISPVYGFTKRTNTPHFLTSFKLIYYEGSRT